MTRPLDKGKLEVLSADECWERLEHEPVGRVAFVEDGDPTILPVNHVVDRRSILFRTTHGAQLTREALNQPIAFEVDGYDRDARTGWSVLVRGSAEEVDAVDVAAELDAAGYETGHDEVGRDQWVRVQPEEVTGRSIPDRT